MLKVLEDYAKATESLAEEFYKKYYVDPSEGYESHPDNWHVIGGYDHMGPDAVSIGDQFWSISDMYTALVNGIETEILWKWYSDHIENREDNGFVNLWHYSLRYKGKPLYTKEDMERSEKAVKKAEKLFHDAIEQCKKAQ